MTRSVKWSPAFLVFAAISGSAEAQAPIPNLQQAAANARAEADKAIVGNPPTISVDILRDPKLRPDLEKYRLRLLKQVKDLRAGVDKSNQEAEAAERGSPPPPVPSPRPPGARPESSPLPATASSPVMVPVVTHRCSGPLGLFCRRGSQVVEWCEVETKPDDTQQKKTSLSNTVRAVTLTDLIALQNQLELLTLEPSKAKDPADRERADNALINEFLLQIKTVYGAAETADRIARVDAELRAKRQTAP